MNSGINSNIKKAFLVYLVLIIIMAVVPIGNSGKLNNTFILSFRVDHILHVLQFIPWAFFFVKMNQEHNMLSAARDLPLWFIWGLLYAVVSEGIQYLIPYRSFNVSDMLANGIGVSAGFVIFVPLGKELRANKS